MADEWSQFESSGQEDEWAQFEQRQRTPEEDAREAAALQALNASKEAPKKEFRNAFGGTAGFDPARMKEWGKGLLAIPASAVNLVTGAVGGVVKLAVSAPLQIAARLDSDVPSGRANDATVEVGDDVAETFATHFGGEPGQGLTNAVAQVVGSPLTAAKWLGDQAAMPTSQVIMENEKASIPEKLARATFSSVPEELRPLLGTSIDAGANIAMTVLPMKGVPKVVKPGKVVATTAVDTLAKAQEKGLRVASYVKKGGAVNIDDAALGHSGVAKTQQLESVKNQPIVQEAVKKALGVPKYQELSFQALDDLEAAPKANLEAIKNLDPGGKPAAPTLGWVESNSTAYQTALDKIVLGDKTAARDFGKLKTEAKSAIEAVVEQHRNLDQGGFGVGAGIDRVFELRKAAREAFKNKQGELGQAYKDVAVAIENAIDEHLAVNGVQTDLIGAFKDHRVKMAQIDAVRQRMNPAGEVDMVALGKDLEKSSKGKGGVPLTGELKELAEIAQVAPKSFQTGLKVGPVTPNSALDTLGAVASGKWSGAATLASRGPMRSFITSKYYQSHGGAAKTVASQIDKVMRQTARRQGAAAALTAGEINAIQGYVDEEQRKSALERAQ